MRIFPGICIALITLLSACSNDHRKQEASHDSSFTSGINAIDRLWDSLYSHPDTLCIPCYDTYLYEVLADDGYIIHGDEVPAGADELDWIGLFKSSDGYYLDHTDISITYHNDVLVDRDTMAKTGKMIEVLHDDTVIILMSEPIISDRQVVKNLLSAQEFPKPDDDTIRFSDGRVDYKLFAAGIKRPANRGYSDYINYKLYLTGSKDGKQVTQIIRASKDFEGDWLLFAGDIDGDGVPDMICKILGENSSGYTLYLSKDLPEGVLLKVAGSWTTTGC